MPPPRNDHSERRVEEIIECATKALATLHQKLAIPESLGHVIQSHIQQSLPLRNSPSLVERTSQFDSLGTDLWNCSAQLVHDDAFPYDSQASTTDRAQLGVLVRVFALLLLDTAHRSSTHRSKDSDQQVRLLKVALRTSRICLIKNALELSIKALEICSHHVSEESSEPMPLSRITEAPSESATEEEVNLKTLTAEYYLLRLMHAWKSNHLELAHHFFLKSDALKIVNNTALSVKAADLFDDIAKSLSNTEQLQDATKWSERAFLALDMCDEDSTTQEAAELKFDVGVSFVGHLLSDGQLSSQNRAWNVVNRLADTHGLQNRVAVEIVKFQVMAAGEHVDPGQVHQALFRIVNMTVLTEDSFKATMRTIRQAMQISPPSAFAALKAFICGRLLPELQTTSTDDTRFETWLEKATITYIMFATSTSQDKSAPIDIQGTKELLDVISGMNRAQFSPKATHAAQTLLWKVADILGTWTSCQLLQHPLFFKSGHMNKARIGRKLMRFALDKSDLSAAREAYFQLPKDAREESLTQFLGFRLALRSQDEDLAAECLRNVIKHAVKDPAHLYACVIEAQQSPMRHMAVMALQAVLGQRPPGIHLACLLRCTVRLLIAELDTAADNQKVNEVALEVLQIFETAAKSVDAFRLASNDGWSTEVQWWCKNAYNLCVRLCGDIDPEYTVRFLTVCSALMERYTKEGGEGQQDDLDSRRLLCAFLATTALIVLGRSEDHEKEHTLQFVLSAQAQIKIFHIQYAKLRNTFQGEAATSANERHLAILMFELECLLKLNQFDRLAPVLQSCLDASSSRGGSGTGRWDTLADILIVIHQKLDSNHTQSAALITTLLQNIINETWKLDKQISKVARWLRYTFTLCLPHKTSEFSLKLLQQAGSMAANGYKGKHERYPEGELQWLATVGFNHAIDLLAEDKVNAELVGKWIEAALELSRWSADEGGLHRVLTVKREVLRERRGRKF